MNDIEDPLVKRLRQDLPRLADSEELHAPSIGQVIHAHRRRHRRTATTAVLSALAVGVVVGGGVAVRDRLAHQDASINALTVITPAASRAFATATCAPADTSTKLTAAQLAKITLPEHVPGYADGPENSASGTGEYTDTRLNQSWPMRTFDRYLSSAPRPKPGMDPMNRTLGLVSVRVTARCVMHMTPAQVAADSGGAATVIDATTARDKPALVIKRRYGLGLMVRLDHFDVSIEAENLVPGSPPVRVQQLATLAEVMQNLS